MGKNNDHDKNKDQRSPKTTGFKNTSSRLRAGKKNNLKHRASIEWRLDTKHVCDVEGYQAKILPLKDLLDTISQSRTGLSLLDAAEKNNVSIVYDTQTAVSQFYQRAEQLTITINPNHPKGSLMNALVRELRHAWQYDQGALVNPLAFEPDEAILVNRAQQADAFMISIKVAWELKLAGLTEGWDHMAGSPMVDMTRTFEIKAQADFRTLNNGDAARATYDKFFEESRTRQHDKSIIHQMLLDDSNYIQGQKKREKISMDLFHRLGKMPQGKNYLSMSSNRMPMDMDYAVIEDRANANFLWFIKFERSFQEKEKQMIEESVKRSAEIVDFAKWAMRARKTTETRSNVPTMQQ